MDRLLNDAEVCKICRSGCDRIEATQCDWRDKDECHNLIVAQLSKADKDWVEWASGKCDKHIVYEPFDSQYHYQDKGTYFWSHRNDCFECWQERKKEIGL